MVKWMTDMFKSLINFLVFVTFVALIIGAGYMFKLHGDSQEGIIITVLYVIGAFLAIVFTFGFIYVALDIRDVLRAMLKNNIDLRRPQVPKGPGPNATGNVRPQTPKGPPPNVEGNARPQNPL